MYSVADVSNQRNFEKVTYNFENISVPADGLGQWLA